MHATWRLMTPPGIAGAVAIVQVNGDIELVFSVMGLGEIGVGGVALRDVCGIDRAIVTRVSPTCLQIMPHGGTAVVRAVLEALTSRGIVATESPARSEMFPEAADGVDAEMLWALGEASSPLAIELLLDQPRRWRELAARRGTKPGAFASEGGLPEAREGECAPATILNRLIVPPLVVAVGPANVGKSTLLNRLAGRGVAIVADEPGTTRDHIGVLLDLGGLVVRYVDTPGVREGAGAIESQAFEKAMEVLALADLVLLVADAGSKFAQPDEMPALACVLRIGLRADRGPTPGSDLSVSALTGEGLPGLVMLVREALIPARAMLDERPWKFW